VKKTFLPPSTTSFRIFCCSADRTICCLTLREVTARPLPFPSPLVDDIFASLDEEEDAPKSQGASFRLVPTSDGALAEVEEVEEALECLPLAESAEASDLTKKLLREPWFLGILDEKGAFRAAMDNLEDSLSFTPDPSFPGPSLSLLIFPKWFSAPSRCLKVLFLILGGEGLGATGTLGRPRDEGWWYCDAIGMTLDGRGGALGGLLTAHTAADVFVDEKVVAVVVDEVDGFAGGTRASALDVKVLGPSRSSPIDQSSSSSSRSKSVKSSSTKSSQCRVGDWRLDHLCGQHVLDSKDRVIRWRQRWRGLRETDRRLNQVASVS